MTTLFGIKNCDTVKKAQKFLTAADIAFDFHDFRADGIDALTVQSFIQQLGLDKVINKRSTTWKQLSDEQKNSLTAETAAAICLEQPTLIKRPVLIHDGQFHIGFKADQYNTIFNIN